LSVAHVPRGEIFYERTAAGGDPAAFVHGSWTDHHGWDAVVPGFARGLEVLTYDRRGHGLSRGEVRPHPVQDDAADLAALLEATDFHPVHLVAHGFGGMVALRLAVDRPELVRSVSLHEPPWARLVDDDPACRAEVDRVVAEVGAMAPLAISDGADHAIPRILALLSGAAEWNRIPAGGRAAILAGSGDWFTEFGDPEASRANPQELRELQVPVLVTVGEESPDYRQRIGERLTESLPNATFVRLPQAAHFPQLTHPDLFVGVLGTFLLDRNVPST
jgi:pimeloyl-ACP methyl ester carboxylesterase